MNRCIDFEFSGREYTAFCPAAAVFDIYDHFPGASDDILSGTGFMEPTRAGWDAACWMLVELCRWGELRRRMDGHDKRPLLTVSQVQMATAEDAARLRLVVRDAIRAGFARYVEAEEDEEVDLTLREIEVAEKKAPPRGLFGRLTSRRVQKS